MIDEQKQPTHKRVLSVILGIIFLCLSFACGFITSCLIGGKNSKVASKLLFMMEHVGCIYDPVTGELREITEEDVADALVNGLLDDYSAYYTKEEYERILENDEGNYSGFGLAFYELEGKEFEIVIGNSPLDRAGVRSGDTFVSASVDGGQLTVFESVVDLAKFFANCSEENVVTLNCLRDNLPYSVQVKRERYVASYVSYYDNEKAYRFLSENARKPQGVESENNFVEISDDAVACIKLDSFEGDASSQMGQALEYMKARGKTKLVLDLRSNGGGLMTVLTNVAEYFIDNGGKDVSLVAHTKGKTKSESYYTNKNKFKDFIEQVVIIGDQNTASASECLIGALVCYGRCDISNVVVEKNSSGVAKTFGKGIMQTTYQFLSGDAFKLTTARIFWPDKTTCIHGKGVTLDMGAVASERGKGLEKAISLFN